MEAFAATGPNTELSHFKTLGSQYLVKLLRITAFVNMLKARHIMQAILWILFFSHRDDELFRSSFCHNNSLSDHSMILFDLFCTKIVTFEHVEFVHN